MDFMHKYSSCGCGCDIISNNADNIIINTQRVICYKENEHYACNAIAECACKQILNDVKFDDRSRYEQCMDLTISPFEITAIVIGASIPIICVM